MMRPNKGNKGTVYLILLWILSPMCLAEAVNYDRQSITIALTQEPPNLNTMRTTDLVSFFVLGHVMEGLTRYDARGRLVAGVAESWEIDDLEVTFHLRKNALWSDGRPSTVGPNATVVFLLFQRNFQQTPHPEAIQDSVNSNFQRTCFTIL